MRTSIKVCVKKITNKLIKELLENKAEYEKMSKASNPYGDGKASKRIADAIIKKYTK